MPNSSRLLRTGRQVSHSGIESSGYGCGGNKGNGARGGTVKTGYHGKVGGLGEDCGDSTGSYEGGVGGERSMCVLVLVCMRLRLISCSVFLFFYASRVWLETVGLYMQAQTRR